MRWPLTHSSVSKADSSPNPVSGLTFKGEQPEIQPAPANSSPKLGDEHKLQWSFARRAGGVCKNPYFSIAGLYLLLLTVLKLVEFFLLDLDAPNRFQLLANAVAYNLVVASWVVLAAGLLYFLVSLLSRRVAVVLAAVFYALLLLSEVGLLFYSLHNGYLLGCELVARPLAESWTATRGAVGVVLPIVLPLLVVGGFIALSLWRARKVSRVVWAVPAVVVVFALLSLFFKPSHLVVNQYAYFILNKTHYLCVDSYDYFHHPGTSNGTAADIPAYDESLVGELLATHPEWGTPADLRYPLERPFTPDTFLNACFLPSDSRPNIVFILVESLGHEFMGTGAMPFVDSLAATGLYWPNCLSATTRSYGAIPAVTGSVGGPRSFQFGTMPDHNSLLSLLKDAGYDTRSYYSGDYTFDCIYEYLTAQRIDHLVSFYDEYCALPESARPNWWGYNDDTLFVRTLRDLNQSSISNSQFSILTTLTMHDKLRLADPALQASYERRAKSLKHSTNLPLLSCLFTDDCLRSFFHAYSLRPDFRNTLFVITGDHASGHQRGDKLSYHHVPLILWSPLVSQPQQFNHIVTHNDIAPALYSLLASKYNLSAQPTVHWLGDGLGPTPKTLLVVNYMHEITDIIYHNCYYQSASRFGPEELYTFGSDMLLTPCSSTATLDSCRRQLDLMRYLYAYTYYANRLTAHPLDARHYTLVRRYRPGVDILCRYPDQLPSIASNNKYDILPASQLRTTEGYSSVRVTVEADVDLDTNLSMLQYPDIRFCFSGAENLREGDRLAKFITTGGRHLSVAKVFPLSDSLPNTLRVELCTPYDDRYFVPGVTLTLSNIQVDISYGK